MFCCPDFIDAHNHVEGSSQGDAFRLPVAIPPLETEEDVLETVKARAAELPPGTWIEGQGTYYQPMPTREQLDEALPDHPVVIRWSAHDVIANRKAMEVSGITRDTPDPPGGVIERGPDGAPTGIFRDARHLLDTPLPTYDDTVRVIPPTLRKLWLEQGVTSVYTMDTLDGVRAYQELRDAGELPPVRLSISFMLRSFDLDSLISTGLRTGFGDNWLKIGAIKILFDGVWGTTAATHAPAYGTTDNFGNLSRSPEQLREEVEKAHAAGWQVWIHCNGDRAQDLALDAFEAALEKHPRDDHRHRIEHFANFMVDDKILDRMEELNVIPVPQASFIWRTTNELLQQPGPAASLHPEDAHRPGIPPAGQRRFRRHPAVFDQPDVLVHPRGVTHQQVWYRGRSGRGGLGNGCHQDAHHLGGVLGVRGRHQGQPRGWQARRHGGAQRRSAERVTGSAHVDQGRHHDR